MRIEFGTAELCAGRLDDPARLSKACRERSDRVSQSAIPSASHLGYHVRAVSGAFRKGTPLLQEWLAAFGGGDASTVTEKETPIYRRTGWTETVGGCREQFWGWRGLRRREKDRGKVREGEGDRGRGTELDASEQEEIGCSRWTRRRTNGERKRDGDRDKERGRE